MNPQMEYHTVSGSKWTFEDDPVKQYVESRLSGRVFNPCCGQTQLSHEDEIVRNDLNTSVSADLHHDIHDAIAALKSRSFGTIVFDPPWSGFQSNDKYQGGHVNWTRDIKEGFNRILKAQGRVINIGYSTVCMPGELEYEREEVAVFQPYGRRKAFQVTVERKRNRLL
jgi:hypothetical protein